MNSLIAQKSSGSSPEPPGYEGLPSDLDHENFPEFELSGFFLSVKLPLVSPVYFPNVWLFFADGLHGTFDCFFVVLGHPTSLDNLVAFFSFFEDLNLVIWFNYNERSSRFLGVAVDGQVTVVMRGSPLLAQCEWSGRFCVCSNRCGGNNAHKHDHV
jgi:hypothetical protein